jgi:cell division protein ZipA
MEDDVFRWVLLALGSCIIAAVAVHGIWTSRKNSKKKAELKASLRPGHKQQFQPSGWQQDEWQHDDGNEEPIHSSSVRDDDFEIKIDFNQDENDDEFQPVKSKNTLGPGEFDDLGVGAVRVVGNNPASVKPAPKVTQESPVEDIPSLADFEPSEKIKQPEAKPVSSGKVYASVVTQPKPEYAAKFATTNTGTKQTGSSTKSSGSAVSNKSSDNYQAPEPPPFLLKTEDKPEPVKKEVDVEALKQAAKETESAVAPAPTPVSSPAESETAQVKTPEKFSLAEQARNLMLGKKADNAKKRREPKIAEDQMRIDFEDEVATETAKPASSAPAKTADIPQEVLVLNVKTPENSPIQGAALLPMLLTLGFKFGDQDIFHRHVNSNGKGPVLFSLANMFKPGNFDIDNLENFTTQGISLFMILPIEGDPHQVFNMMHNAARKIADEFASQVYDGRRALLTKQSLQQYVEKIREFERKRMVNR